eukprot:SAG22_NODE_403_length_11012_cov_12.141024_3_plen_67_part_00
MNDYFHGLQYSETGDCATMVSSNYKMCYDVVPSALLDDEAKKSGRKKKSDEASLSVNHGTFHVQFD